MDDLEPQLVRWFAAAERSLTDADFTARIATGRRRRLAFCAPRRICAVIWHSLGNALPLPLRMRPALAGLVATVAVAIALGLVLQS